MFFRNLKKEMLVFTLGITSITIFVTTLLSISSTQMAGSEAEKATGAVLREQAKESLVQIVKSATDRHDLLFEQVTHDARSLASYVKNIRENPSVFARNAYWEFDTHVFKQQGRYLNSASDISTIHIPAFVVLDADEKKNIERTAYLDFVAPAVLENNQNTAAIWVVDEKGVTRYFPNTILGNIAPPDYDPREDIFFKPATPEKNPERNVIWSALYDDPAGQGLMITATVPIYTKNGFSGVLGIDVLLESIIKIITAYSPIEGSYAFLVDNEGGTIAFPSQAYKDILGRPRAAGEVRTNLTSASPAFRSLLKEMTRGATGFGSILSGEKKLFVAYAPLKQTAFSMAVVAEETVMLKAASVLRGEIVHSVQDMITQRILPASALIILLAAIISVLFVTKIVNPIHDVIRGAHEVGRGNLDYKITVNSKNEIGDLASSFTQMSQDLKRSREALYEYSKGLEEKVKERTKELEQVNAHLRELDRQKSEFVSIASHQIRSPLTAIKGYASLLLEGSFGPLVGQVREAVDRIFRSGSALALIVDDFLNISRIEQGRLKYTFTDVDLTALITAVANEQRPVAEKAGLALEVRIETTAPTNAQVDEEKIHQVITNLVDNAIKYTPQGAITIAVTQPQDEESVRVSIRDSGIGIAHDTMPILFTKFGRADNASTHNVSGTGLGLYIARQIALAHGGKIWAESEGDGKGATFHLELRKRLTA